MVAISRYISSAHFISREALEVRNLDSIYPYYGYCNDTLVKLNAFGMRGMDVVMPARYWRETSSIKYRRYICKVAPMIFRSFLWRLKTEVRGAGFSSAGAVLCGKYGDGACRIWN